MKEIKLKAWNKDEKRFLNSKELGFYTINDMKYDDPIVFLLYTGLKDKNKDEIYVGHIIKEPYYVDENNGFLILEVLFYNGQVMGKVLNKKGFGLQKLTIYKEIIGNIYENPELLNKGTK